METIEMTPSQLSTVLKVIIAAREIPLLFLFVYTPNKPRRLSQSR